MALPNHTKPPTTATATNQATRKIVTRRQLLRTSTMGAIGIAAASSTTHAASGQAIHTRKRFRWKMVTTWPKNFPGLGTSANHLAEKIKEMTDGDIVIKVYGAGEIVPAMGIFDAVSRGTAEVGHGASYYWKGKHAATPFFAAVPFGLTSQEQAAWIHNGGGQKLWDAIYAPFNLIPFAAGYTGVQMGGWFNKQINSVKDFKGLKMRMPGLGGDVLRRLGATVVAIPGGEIFQALKTGAIDATEWVGPYNDMAFGLHKAAKYYYWPGWHEPGTTLECFFNAKAFNSLPKHYQQIVRVACQAEEAALLSEYTMRNQIALKLLVTQHSVVLKRFPDAVLRALGKLSDDVVRETAKKDKLTQAVYTSYVAFRQQAIGLAKITEEAYSVARSLNHDASH